MAHRLEYPYIIDTTFSKTEHAAMHITLRQLEAFHAIARGGSLTAAASQLNLSKGALSATLQQLEGHLGSALFDRQSNRLYLNPQGRNLLPQVDSLLAQLRAIEAGKTQRSGWGNVRLGASNTIGTYLLPPLLAHLQQQEVGPLPQISMANSATLAQWLLGFELDLALIEGEIRHPELRVIPWRSDELVVIAAANHPLTTAQAGSINPALNAAQLAKWPWVVREQGSGSRVQVEQFLAGLPWQPALVLPSTEALVRAVAAGLGLGLVSATVLGDDGRRQPLVTLPLSQPRQRQLYLVHHRSKAGDPQLAQLLASLQAASDNGLI